MIETTLISELAEEDRKAAEQEARDCIKMLRGIFRQCEMYLQDYGAGRQNVAKTYTVLVQTAGVISDAGDDLIRRHSPKHPIAGPATRDYMISEISEADLQSVKDHLGILPSAFRYCEGYRRNYEAGQTNAVKLLNTIKAAQGALKDARDALIKTHHLEGLDEEL